ncbi:MAG: hypothetical protein HC884_18940, partial [Chloroflexaceae bacterium]|nr:hypothetical protein [Chloroflexaceae bacterium]
MLLVAVAGGAFWWMNGDGDGGQAAESSPVSLVGGEEPTDEPRSSTSTLPPTDTPLPPPPTPTPTLALPVLMGTPRAHACGSHC